MFSYLWYQISRSVATFFRTLRAFFVRKAVSIASRFRRLTNFSRHATKAASSSLQGVVSAAQKPTGPDDYVETGRLYIAKSLIIKIVLTLVAIALILYFLVWPFLLSRFFTARFYEQDKRVADWNGKVIVYSDKKKTVPRYAGRLETGVLQGEGKEYDGEGLLIYQGQFRDGLRSGNGEEFRSGVLVYEGQFAEGLYNGRGKLYEDSHLLYEGQFADGKYAGRGALYAGGVLICEGEFEDGLPDGACKLYDENGTLRYDGTIAAGELSGSGKVFDENGTLRYQGELDGGEPSGSGKLFDEDGRLTYQGELSGGVPDGEGTLYPEEGTAIHANFAGGEPEGTVEWSKNGTLYYEGEWSDGAPEGFGTIFGRDGEPLFKGELKGGAPDGEALMNMSEEELIKALGADNVETIPFDGKTFLLTSPALGLAAQFSYQTETDPPQLQAVCLFEPEGDGWVETMAPNGGAPGTEAMAAAGSSDAVSAASPDKVAAAAKAAAAAAAAAASDPAKPDAAAPGTAADAGSETAGNSGSDTAAPGTTTPGTAAPGGSDAPDNPDAPNAQGGSGEDGQTDEPEEPTVEAWAVGGGDASALGEQMANAALGVTSAAEVPKTDDAVDEFTVTEGYLDSLDHMSGTSGVVSLNNPYYGGRACGQALRQCKSPDALRELVDALIDYWINSEQQAAYEAMIKRIDTLLDSARSEAAMGTRGEQAQKDAKELEAQKLRLRNSVQSCQTRRKQAELRAQHVASIDPAQYSLSTLMTQFDPAQMDRSRAASIAVSYWQSVGKEFNDDDMELDVKILLADMEDSYGNLLMAKRAYQRVADEVKVVAGNYSMGKASRTDWYNVLDSQTTARTALYGALRDFTSQANRLNYLTGGWVSRTQHWFEDEMGSVYRAAMPGGGG